ncbi:MAG: hypothetical protein JST89_00370 [Cyanobacteria bacterium SZAS-4]|nr:hypothetical protein [Cyanobacteria bacterium SZAS-4]
MKRQRKTDRNSKGVSIAEFGPALIVLLIFFFFPLVDVLSVCLSFGLCTVLNTNQLHEASLEPWQDAADPNGIVMKKIPTAWANGMGRFVKQSGVPVTVLSYRDGSQNSEKQVEKVVRIETTVVCNPAIPLPIPIANIPGLNGPFTVRVSAEKAMENPDYAR